MLSPFFWFPFHCPYYHPSRFQLCVPIPPLLLSFISCLALNHLILRSCWGSLFQMRPKLTRVGCPRRSAIQETMSSSRTVSWQLLGLQSCSSLSLMKENQYTYEGQSKDWREARRSLICVHILMYFCICQSISIVLTVKVKARLLSTFLAAVPQESGLLCFSYFIFLRRC